MTTKNDKFWALIFRPFHKTTKFQTATPKTLNQSVRHKIILSVNIFPPFQVRAGGGGSGGVQTSNTTTGGSCLDNNLQHLLLLNSLLPASSPPSPTSQYSLFTSWDASLIPPTQSDYQDHHHSSGQVCGGLELRSGSVAQCLRCRGL